MEKWFSKFAGILAVILLFYFPAQSQTTPADNMVITTNGGDVNNLMKVGDANITKEGLILPSQQKLYKKAEDELRKRAASLGANVIYIKSNQFVQEPVFSVHLIAEFYKNPAGASVQTGTMRPSNLQDNVVTNINSGIDFNITGCTGDAAAQTVTIYFTFSNPRKSDNRIGVHGGFYNNPVVAFDNDGNQFPLKAFTLAGTSNDYLLERELPTGLTLKGSITYSNVLSQVQKIAVAKIAVSSRNWDDGRDNVEGMIVCKNVVVNWNGQVGDNGNSTFNNNTIAPQPVLNTSIKNLNNGIDFTVSECKGDANAQTVTVFFTFSNPRKSNQKITISGGFYNNPCTAFDVDGNQFPLKSFSLAGANNNYSLEKELPTNLTLKGSITYSNVLSTVTVLAMAKIPVTSSNWDGGANAVSGMIEVKNIAVNWGNRAAVGKHSTTATGADYLSYNDLLTKLNTGENITNKKVILDNLYFQTNETTITENSKTTLQNILRLLIKYPRVKITILGHTDNVGRDDDNQSLSFGRAKAVVTYLVSKGINRDRLFYKGFGSTIPIDDNNTAEGRAKNRRTELEIMEQ